MIDVDVEMFPAGELLWGTRGFVFGCVCVFVEGSMKDCCGCRLAQVARDDEMPFFLVRQAQPV